ncbi:MAG TPA: hypothetical protein VFB20_13485 [Burkholderiales bacterium]|nr:hypothetical protein [Burkholderiales bacterium]
MLNANRISETPSPEAGVSRDLGAIVAWLRGLSRAEIGDLIEALEHHDAEKMTHFHVRFYAWMNRSK